MNDFDEDQEYKDLSQILQDFSGLEGLIKNVIVDYWKNFKFGDFISETVVYNNEDLITVKDNQKKYLDSLYCTEVKEYNQDNENEKKKDRDIELIKKKDNSCMNVTINMNIDVCSA